VRAILRAFPGDEEVGAVRVRLSRFGPLLWALSWSAGAHAYTRDVGNVAVIEDVTGAIHDTSGFWGPDQLCRETAKVFYQCHGDDYDIFVAFTAKPIRGFEDQIRNVQQGTPVQNAVQGIGYNAFNFTALYGSAGRLEQCVSMQSLDSIPDDPEGPATAFLGLPLGLTGAELLGHELGHRWLIGVEFDKNDGQGPQHYLRGYEGESPNLHYSYYTDSQSVMYGNFITDKGNGAFEICGGVRGYGPLDQYLMGLRPADEVPPLLVLSDGSGAGSPAVAKPRGTCDTVTSGFTRVDVTLSDIVRTMGPRVPDASQAKHHFKVGFLLATEQGVDATGAQVAKVEAYRARFQTWFPTATNNRGTVDTTLGPESCGEDGGAPRPDGGKPPEDAGIPPDAGTSPDAGGPDDAGTAAEDGGGAADGGAGADAGVARDAGAGGDGGGTRSDGGTAARFPAGGCTCDLTGASSTGAFPFALLGVWVLARWARRRRGAPC
jgi:hypothetical protein